MFFFLLIVFINKNLFRNKQNGLGSGKIQKCFWAHGSLGAKKRFYAVY